MRSRATIRGDAVANVWTIFIGMAMVIIVLFASSVYLRSQIESLFSSQNQTLAHNHQTGLATHRLAARTFELQLENHAMLCALLKTTGTLEPKGVDCR